jgi:hypothetical protein
MIFMGYKPEATSTTAEVLDIIGFFVGFMWQLCGKW